MGRPKETSNKKEQTKKKLQKKRDKEARKMDRMANSNKGKDFMDMLVYVDENGNIVETPPDPKVKNSEVSLDDIEIQTLRKEDRESKENFQKGVVKLFNEEKGFGFITNNFSRSDIFFHVNNLVEEVRVGDRVQYETEKTAKGLAAISVRKL